MKILNYSIMMLLILLAVMVFYVPQVHAQDTQPTIQPADVQFYKAAVLEIDNTVNDYGAAQQIIHTKILSADLAGQLVDVTYYPSDTSSTEYVFSAGDTVVLSRSDVGTGEIIWGLNDRYRLPWMIVVGCIFIGFALTFGGIRRGLSALAGLGFSIVMLVQFMIPQISNGANPMVVGLIGAIIISVVSIYLAHGFNRQTSVAVLSTLVTISIAMLLAWLAILVTQLYGTGSEEAYIVQQFSALPDIDLRGLLLVGIVIGMVGVLDDVTTSLTAAIKELKHANHELNFKDLLARGLRIGHEHISSLINTLVLAYAGAAMPMLLLFSVDTRPFWVLINSQFMAEEIIRALIGSTAIVLGVPITALLAAYYFSKQPNIFKS